jgi:hypothetical protein
MKSEIFLKNELEQLLKANWTKIINKEQLLKTILEHVRDNNYTLIDASSSFKLTVTKVTLHSNIIEFCVEFSIPKSEKSVFGTHIYHLDLSGNFSLKEVYGLNNI